MKLLRLFVVGTIAATLGGGVLTYLARATSSPVRVVWVEAPDFITVESTVPGFSEQYQVKLACIRPIEGATPEQNRRAIEDLRAALPSGSPVHIFEYGSRAVVARADVTLNANQLVAEGGNVRFHEEPCGDFQPIIRSATK